MEDLRESYLHSKKILSGKEFMEPVISSLDDLEVWRYLRRKSLISSGKGNIQYALSHVNSYIRVKRRR